MISTLAAYQIDKENIVSIEFTNGLRQARLGGEQRSTGLDIDTTVELSDHINLIGAFSALDATFKTGPNVGMRPRLTSQYSGSIFTRYEAKKGLLENLTLLAGINYVGERFADDENTFTIDGYAVSEVGVLYTLPFKHWLLRTQINIKNVFDKPHILSNEGNIRITEGEGRNTQLTLSLRF